MQLLLTALIPPTNESVSLMQGYSVLVVYRGEGTCNITNCKMEVVITIVVVPIMDMRKCPFQEEQHYAHLRKMEDGSIGKI